jgi:phage shock protein E
MELLNKYWPMILVALYFGYKFYKKQKIKKMLPSLISQNAQIIDVRSVGEFAMGNDPRSMNIPLNQLGSELQKINKQTPVIVVCRSGSRSAMGSMVLKRAGYENVYNAGAWQNLLSAQ